jgi:hypothetical protein
MDFIDPKTVLFVISMVCFAFVAGLLVLVHLVMRP